MKSGLFAWVLVCVFALTGCGDTSDTSGDVPGRSAGFQTAPPQGEQGSTNGSTNEGTNSSGEGESTSSAEGESSGCETDEDCSDMLIGLVCRSATCDVSSGICSVGVVPDGTPCGDEEMCKSAGACGQGFCIGQPLKCDDGNPCTDGSCKEGVGCVYFDNAAPCDDTDPCTANDLCAAGKCTGTPVASCGEGCGDGSCGEGEDCQNCSVDCGPCATDACGSGEVEACDGGCAPSTYVGDGTCQPELDCASTGYDGGDCSQSTGSCGLTEVEVCGGVCLNAGSFAEFLVNASCDEALNCSTYDYDNGACLGGPDCGASDFICADGACISSTLICDGAEDCADGSDEANCSDPGTCEAGKQLGCNGSCYKATWFGDGTCDSFLDCEATDYDGGDCSGSSTGGDQDEGPECEAGKVLVCAGTYCLDASWLGDGMCDAPMDCAANDYDGGDCEGSTSGSGGSGDSDLECEEGKEPNCSQSYCYNSVWIGDGTCDSFFNCSATEFDGGDCL